MANAVNFRTFRPEDSRGDLHRRIENAPVEHAEAILAAYDLLQKLNDSGLLSMASGALSAGESITEHIVDVVSSQQAVTALRALLTFGSLLNTLDPDQLHAAFVADEKKSSIVQITKGLLSKEFLRVATAGVKLVKVLGAALLKRDSEASK